MVISLRSRLKPDRLLVVASARFWAASVAALRVLLFQFSEPVLVQFRAVCSVLEPDRRSAKKPSHLV
ncbi:hypothetical protein D3C71_1812370 [compost metagenome]